MSLHDSIDVIESNYRRTRFLARWGGDLRDLVGRHAPELPDLARSVVVTHVVQISTLEESDVETGPSQALLRALRFHVEAHVFAARAYRPDWLARTAEDAEDTANDAVAYTWPERERLGALLAPLNWKVRRIRIDLIRHASRVRAAHERLQEENPPTQETAEERVIRAERRSDWTRFCVEAADAITNGARREGTMWRGVHHALEYLGQSRCLPTCHELAAEVGCHRNNASRWLRLTSRWLAAEGLDRIAS